MHADDLQPASGPTSWPAELASPLRIGLTRLAADTRFATLNRSLAVYFGDSTHARAMDAHYSAFVAGGDLVFDIGAHVGDRIASFRRLGARVVALEPQPLCLEALDALFGADPGVTIVGSACGRAPGSLRLHVNRANPTVTTASDSFIGAARDAEGWREQVWDDQLEVPVTTLDALIATYGVPAFAKIDVEGFEAEVLAGLSRQLPALSFEFTTIQRDIALAAVDLIEALGPGASFNVALGETQSFACAQWVPADRIRQFVADLPHAANSGDIYARFGTGVRAV